MTYIFTNLIAYKKIFFLAFSLILHFVSFAQTQPNVILILTDDQGWGDLSLHDNPWVETPHLDNLAKSGKEFTNFYVSPLCAPSRASILTGRYHLNTGVLSVSKRLEIMDTEETTLAELFKANGYKTGIFGKWHNGEHFPNRPNDQGFDEFLGFCAGHLSNYFNTTLEQNNTRVKTNGYITDVLTDAAIRFIAKNKNDRFFCYIPFNAPHSPYQVTEKYFSKYKAKGLCNELATVYGMVDNLDENVGRILQYLKDNKLEENTIVMFLSDNGPNGIRYNGTMKGIKGSVHEGGVRVPFFIRWKNHISEWQKDETPIAHVDIYPTLQELCKLKIVPGKPIAGKSLASLILNNRTSFDANRNIYTHVNFMEVPTEMYPGSFRNARYRFVFEKDKPQLYDLLLDPDEKTDISGINNELTKQFLSEYTAWFTSNVAGFNYNRPIILSKKGVELPVYEATLSPGIKFKEGHGWAHDWVEKWNTTSDSLYWEIDCKAPGTYNVEIEYLCKKADTGSRVLFSIGNKSREVIIDQEFYATQIPSPDRVPRKEAYEMSRWKILKVGIFFISDGKQQVKLRAVKIKNKNVAELNLVRLVPVQ